MDFGFGGISSMPGVGTGGGLTLDGFGGGMTSETDSNFGGLSLQAPTSPSNGNGFTVDATPPPAGDPVNASFRGAFSASGREIVNTAEEAGPSEIKPTTIVGAFDGLVMDGAGDGEDAVGPATAEDGRAGM